MLCEWSREWMACDSLIEFKYLIDFEEERWQS
ncbi:MAG: hypothetical protein QOE96_3366 [Blastocatellia bacterium]|jgi:hypothetical protein|nr:hypothetical protein [Blastocatellia bacterium]